MNQGYKRTKYRSQLDLKIAKLEEQLNLKPQQNNEMLVFLRCKNKANKHSVGEQKFCKRLYVEKANEMGEIEALTVLIKPGIWELDNQPTG